MYKQASTSINERRAKVIPVEIEENYLLEPFEGFAPTTNPIFLDEKKAQEVSKSSMKTYKKFRTKHISLPFIVAMTLPLYVE